MNFSDIRNHLYNETEKNWRIAILLGLSAQIVSISSTFIQNSGIVALLNFFLFLTPVAAQWFREKSKDLSQRALTCRLAIVYSDSFGREIPPTISKEISSWVHEKKLDKAPFKKPYFDSKLSPGTLRLADVVSESAFWTYNLARDMTRIMVIYTGIYVLFAISSLYFLLQVGLSSDIIVNAAKVVVIFTSLVFTGEALLLIKQYNELYQEARQTFEITAKMALRKKLPVEEIMQVVEKYDLSLVSSPPIPSRLYLMRRPYLNKAYKKVLKIE